MGLLVLLLLDPGQHFAQMLVLDDSGVADRCKWSKTE
jgi:hypothetical protein